MEAGNRVIVRSDAAGCTRGPGGREFGGVGSVADSAVRLGVGWLAVGPGREWPAQPRASPGEDAKLVCAPSRVSRPAIEKKRRRRVLVVTSCSPRPMRAAQRARLCASAWRASQAALAAKRPAGRCTASQPASARVGVLHGSWHDARMGALQRGQRQLDSAHLGGHPPRSST